MKLRKQWYCETHDTHGKGAWSLIRHGFKNGGGAECVPGPEPETS